MIRRRVVVTGRVQGVFFRDSCRRQAVAAGVTGWVRNLPDGTVEAAFEGTSDAVDRMVKWTREGPPDAVVYGTTVSDEPPEGDDTFAVLPTPR
ncbi:acylphosphatase [Asanoa siamensis]|uniref:Acylphosphatase n=1 Tax=Asanoa siamensis TaxID=926357 RepID=A0ABQ4CQC8_9ACTN|nr:acylphosphatase [Asanoa siamensis]GIF73480.1 acylphosphatase [Asanoa siamensis]